jgi:diguanylate cyclase (GGDEF)-like protein/PAS domain S-box-containing protein
LTNQPPPDAPTRKPTEAAAVLDAELLEALDDPDNSAWRLLDLVAAPIYALDADGTIQYANEGVERVCGHAPGELIGRAAADLVTPDSAERGNATIQQLLADPEPASDTVEFIFDSVDERHRHCETRITVLTDDAGRYRGHIGVIRDITEKWRRRQRSSHHQLIFERTHEGLLLARRDGDGQFRYVEANPAIGEMLGCDPCELVGRRPQDVFPETFARRSVAVYERVLEHDTPEEVTHDHPLSNDLFVIRSRMQPFDYDTDDRGVLVMVQDVTELTRTERELEMDNAALRALYEVAGRSDLDLSDKIRRLLETGCSRLDLPIGFMTEIADGRQRIRDVVGHHPELQPGTSAPLEESYCRKTIERDDLVAYENAPEEGMADDPAYERYGLNCYLGGKVEVGGDLIGTVCFAGRSSRERPFNESERTFVRLLVEWISREFDREKLLDELTRRARRDSLTGLLNHGELMERLGEEIDRARRHGHALSFLMLDLDHFKDVNDRLGHPTGDEVLQSVAELLDGETRASDVAGRYGGEEFAMILPHADLEESREIGERIRRGIEECRVGDETEECRITCSVGVANLQPEPNDPDQLVKRADRALYRAKEKGRNRVAIAE